MPGPPNSPGPKFRPGTADGWRPTPIRNVSKSPSWWQRVDRRVAGKLIGVIGAITMTVSPILLLWIGSAIWVAVFLTAGVVFMGGMVLGDSAPPSGREIRKRGYELGSDDPAPAKLPRVRDPGPGAGAPIRRGGYSGSINAKQPPAKIPSASAKPRPTPPPGPGAASKRTFEIKLSLEIKRRNK